MQQVSQNTYNSISKLPYPSPCSPSKKAESIYKAQIKKWVDYLKEHHSEPESILQVCARYYLQFFLPSLHNEFKINMIFDNLVSKIISRYLKELQNIRFSFTKSKENIKDPSSCRQQPWIYLLIIAHVLRCNKFISESCFAKIKISEICGQKNSLQKRFEDYCLMISQKKKQNNHSKYIINAQEWKDVVGIECQEFWSSYIFTKSTLMKGNTIMQSLFWIFQDYLRDRFEEKLIKRIGQLIGVQLQQQTLKSTNKYLQNIAYQLWLFNDKEKTKQIQKQLDFFKEKLKLQKYFPSSQISYHTYGSYQSKISLQCSDIDLCIFISNQQKEFSQQREFIKRCISKVFSILYKYFKLSDQDLKIQKVFSVNNDKIKVPFVRVNFSNEMPLNKIDITFNNIYAVKNSKMLQKYAQNPMIRGVSLLIKKWAKNQRLIQPTKLSSYGLCLMLLYFLMKTGQLEYISQKNIDEMDFNNKLSGKLTLFEILCNFFEFYSENSLFYKQKQVGCIIKGCNDHQDLINQQFIINIHDPFDNSNVGRMKKTKIYEYFKNFNEAYHKFSQANKIEDDEKKQQEIRKLLLLRN